MPNARRLANAGLAALRLLYSGVANTLLHFGVAPGDDLLCTTVARELRCRGVDTIWMMSRYPELFRDNPDITGCIPIHRRYTALVRALGGQAHNLSYCSRDWETDHDTIPQRHILAELCACAGIEGRITLKPYFTVQNESKYSDIAHGRIVLQTSSSSATFPMENKEWFPERFQAVVDELGGAFEFVQIGRSEDPPLTGVIDLRGETSIPELAAVLSGAKMFVGLVGFVMHLARAVGCRSVIVFGGRELPWQSGYPCNENLSSPIACSPCWRWNQCDYDRECMRSIGEDQVVAAIRRLQGRLAEPLEIDTVELGHATFTPATLCDVR